MDNIIIDNGFFARKASAERYGIGAIDRIAVNGYSGGMCICDMLSDCYGDSLPNDIYPDYIPDDTDRINSDCRAALPIYGAAMQPEQIEKMIANPKLPPIFMTAGQDDFVSLDSASAKLYLALKDVTPIEVHLFAKTGHGFGVGPSEDVTDPARPVEGMLTNVQVWPSLADTFLKLRWGLEKQFVPNA